MHKKEIEGLKILCKYSSIPNSLGYCGKENSYVLFNSFLKKPTKEKGKKIKKIIKTFVGLSPYLRIISDSNGLTEFDEEVAQAYWLGNKLLDNIDKEELKKMILEDFTKPGMLPYYIAEQKANNLKSKVFPNHSFHVLYINFVTKKVKPILSNLNNCLIKPAIYKDKNFFITTKLSLVKDKLDLKKTIKKFETQKKCFSEKIFSTHWNTLVDEITKEEQKNLEKYTNKNLNLANSCLQSSKS
ncbi:MAG: DUF6390 family protein [Candidatus Diapherotrites archaeon]